MGTYVADEARYDSLEYRSCGRSGLRLPRLSLGLWQNFGGDRDLEGQRRILRRAFDLGVFHFDLANNYGPPPGSAEENLGRILARDFGPYRDELVITTKAGWVMGPGPHQQGGSRKYLLSSLDRSLERMGLDHVDVFYSHRPDPDTPLEETMTALHHAVVSGRAVYAGISSYGPSLTRRAAAIMRDLGTPLVVHQPSYSMLNRWVEDGLLDAAADEGMGVVAFSPLAQGLLTSRYLDGSVPADSRAGVGRPSWRGNMLTDEVLGRARALDRIAAERGQTLAQMAISWVLRDQGPRTVTTALIGASSVEQLEQNLGAADSAGFSDEELREIDRWAVDSDVNIWWGATASKD
ncbi:glyceraldehyde 3-phosphate reductase [Nocardiopsis terrae]|uniref:L-glyceraldehyde 3-phosphate reductase n=1 Tax=Nocardiopsis terrae TaxID=372655 RepID=A0ABR9HDQ1_9ACTN|nr:aldo/keto reductase [Nocardiopsis terrae]MBE1457156.1 L-glyceraldehyde 3-phosphate reductase [Nocardiopsis terrae]GHC90926.1 glyceraldehyde 3-phosphate reductase [Nocardiopsis terrae]